MEFVNYKAYRKQVKNLYKSAFPYDERFPMPFLYWKARGKDNNFCAVLDKGEFVGLSYTVESENFLYVYYLAVIEEARNKGLGSKILAKIKEENPNRTITLAVEDTEVKDAPNYEMRLRRLEFYRRNGFERLNMKINEAGVWLELLGTDDTVNYDEFIALMKKFLGRILFRIIYKYLWDKNRKK